MSVSLTMIVRNEASNLEACLSPVCELFDEIVVVDTGSTDGTKAIAERLGARVLDFPWCDDFSAARNAALNVARGDWIFWLDADDRVAPAEIEKLRALFASLSDDLAGYLLPCVCMTPEAGVGAVEQVRLFRNDPRVRWIYRVHEQIADGILAMGGELRRASVPILHTGYRDATNERAKLERNFRLIELDCVEHAGDPYPLHHLGAMLLDRGRIDEAVAAFERCLPMLPPGTAAERKTRLLLGKARRNGARMTVSLTMIVKNEAANLEACIEPVSELVDEIIVVDTGSTDETKEIAERLGARVFDFPWCDSFAAARNEALGHATSDWIFILDADDRVAPSEKEKLRSLFENLGDENAGWMMGHVCLGADGVVVTTADQVRLFRKRSDVRWEYRVHEQIVPSIAAAGGTLRHAGIRILHTGFRKGEIVDSKVHRNLRLVEMDCAELPLDPFPMFYRGAMLADIGRSAEAIVTLEICKSIALGDTNMAMRISMMLARAYKDEGDYDRALEEIRSGRARFPDDATLACHEAELLIHRGEIEAAGACLLPLIHGEQRDLTAHDLRVRGLLGEIWMELGRHQAAEELAREITRIRPGYGPAWLVLADALLAQGKDPELDALQSELAAIPGAQDACASIRAARLSGDARLSRCRPPWGEPAPKSATKPVRAEPLRWHAGRITLPS